MERSYKLLPKAKLDLENIFHYILVDLVNPESALGLIEKFEAKFKDICMFSKA
jgi:plasmid stabilization system protein ParE